LLFAKRQLDVNQVQRPLQDLSGRIRYLDEVLTSSALLAAATGDPGWQKRYQEYGSQLEAVFPDAVRLAPKAKRQLAGIEEANTELVMMETDAFDNVRSGKKAAAWQLLNGAKYRLWKQRYAAALASFIADLDAHQQVLLAQARAETKAFVALTVGLAVVILLLFVAGGWVVLRSLRRE
jgi:hypothetical protein